MEKTDLTQRGETASTPGKSGLGHKSSSISREGFEKKRKIFRQRKGGFAFCCTYSGEGVNTRMDKITCSDRFPQVGGWRLRMTLGGEPRIC